MGNEEPLSVIELKFAGCAEGRFTKALKKQMELHEGVTFMDLLKFLYQSSLGPFHLFEMMNETELGVGQERISRKQSLRTDS